MWRIIAVLGALVVLGLGCGRSQGSLLLLQEVPDVGSITIEGNRRFSDGELKGLMTLQEASFIRPFASRQFSTRQLDTDILAILTHYYRHGYLRARVHSRQTVRRGDEVDIALHLTEGGQVLVASIALLPEWEAPPLVERGVDPASLRRRVTLKEGRPFDPFRLEDDRRAILGFLRDRGFLLAEVRPDVHFEGDRALVFLVVEPGESYRVNSVNVLPTIPEDADSTAPAPRLQVGRTYLLRVVEVEPGDTYRQSEILKSQEQLLQTGYFNDVRWRTTGVDTARRTVDLEFRVNQRKLHWIEGGVGISSDNRIRVTGTWGTRAFTRIGMRLALVSRTDLDMDRGVGSYIDEHDTELLLRQSNVLGTRWEGQPSTSFTHDREEDYEQNIVGAGVAFRRRLTGLRDQVVLGLENRWVNNTAEAAAVERDAQLGRASYQTRLATARLQLDSRNDFFAPSRGSFREAVLEVAGGALGGNNGFRKFTGSMSKFVPVDPGRMILAFRIQAGAIDASNAPTTVSGDPVESEVQLVPVEDRYVLGGANTVRGFAQDELDGSRRLPAPGEADPEEGGILSLLANLETRVGLFSRFSVVGFMDAGNVWQDDGELSLSQFVPHADPDEVDPADLRYTFGGGLRVATPVGPVRLDYARKWNIPAALAEGKDSWHVSLGHAF